MWAIALLLVALPGCSLAIAGDSSENCERLNAAMRALAERCGGTPQQLECAVMWSDMTESRVDDCIEETLAIACTQDLDGRCGFSSTRFPF